MINQIFNMRASLIFSSKVSFRESLCCLTSPFHAAYKDTGGGNETVGFKTLLSRCHLFSSCDISWQPYSILEVWGLLETIWQNCFFLWSQVLKKGFSNKRGTTKLELVKRDFISFILPGVCQPGKDKCTSAFEHPQWVGGPFCLSLQYTVTQTVE